MSFWSTLPFVRITIVLIGGILWAYCYPIAYNILGVGLVILVTCYIVLIRVLVSTRSYALHHWVGVIGLISIFFTGALCLSKYRSKPSLQLSDIRAYVAVALEDAIQREERLSVTVTIQRVKLGGKWVDLVAKVRLHVADPATTTITYGDVYMVLGSPKLINGPLNPNEFDYKTFLSHENIYYQHRVSPSTIRKIGYKPPSQFQALLFQASRFCKDILTHYIRASRERSIVLALILGIKDELDYEVRDAYAGTGTMHVLAVSGLHVGILYWILNLLFGRLNKYKQTKWIASLAVLIGLWIYAGITGLTPSVLRATLMFSFLIVGKLLRRPGNIYNILAISAFVLLVCKPTLIFSVSFQLSYLAVLGIVYLQPRIYRWFKFNNFILRQLWLWTSVSLAAQLATTPISLYYFHQFPSYFVFANWVVVPAAFLIFTLGLGVLLTSWWGWLSTLIAWILEQVTWIANQFVGWVNCFPYSVIENIYLPVLHLFLCYGLLITLLVFFYRKKFQYLILASCWALWLGISSINKILQDQSQQGVIFYSIPSHQVVGFFKNRHAILFVDGQFDKRDKRFSYHIKPSQLAMGIHTDNQYTFKQAVDMPTIPLKDWKGVKIAAFREKIFVFIDKPITNWPILDKKLQVDFLIIEQNSISSLDELLDKFACKTCIIGTSNTKPLAEQLKLEAEKLHLNTHVLHQQGAFKISCRH